MKRVCSECGSANVHTSRGSYQFKESGLNVVLQGIEIEKCEACKSESPIIPRMNDLMRTIALAVIAKPYALTGEDVRYLRKYLGMTGDALSRLIHIDRTTLSKWENNDDRIGQQSDLLIRSVAIGLGPGLCEKMEKLMRDFERIKKTRKKVSVSVDAQTHEYEYA